MEKQIIKTGEKLRSFLFKKEEYAIIVMVRNHKIIGFFTGLLEILSTLPDYQTKFYCVKKSKQEEGTYFDLCYRDREDFLVTISTISRNFPNGPSVCAKLCSKFYEEGYETDFIINELKSILKIKLTDPYVPAIIDSLEKAEKKIKEIKIKNELELELEFNN